MLPAERHARASELFIAALTIEPAGRAGWLREACSDDEALRAEVESLLDSESRAEGLLSGDALGCRIAWTEVLETDDVETRPVPERIGRYRVLSSIGHGGMGVVYLAEQDHPARTVALKLLRSDTFSPARLRRFELEAEILGRLQHRGIAQIFDAGTADTDAGPRAFIAMELVVGKPLLEFARGLPLRRKLETLRELCDAVQHAHQHGVIHRDLKPANVLVDEAGQPKVLDFGVARAEFDASSTATLPGELVGTLPYMSPEQISGAAHGVDTRCDVYALGLIGFELVAGRSPYDFDDKSWPEIARAIREDEPLRLGAIDRAWHGDLETIIAKALEKDRTRRYASAAQLGADIERFLRDEPIAARAPTTLYQLTKFARRNRVLVGGVAATFVALALGVIASSISLVHAKESERLAAREAKVRAAINDYTTRLLAAPDPSVDGRDVRLIDVLDRLAAGLETQFANDPEVEAGLRSTIGWTYYKLGLLARAEPHVRRAFELRKRVLGMEHVDTLESVTQLTPLLVETGQIEEVEPLCREALEICRRVRGPTAPTTLALEEDYAGVLRERGRFVEAAALLRHCVEGQRQVRGANSSHVYVALCNLANLEATAGHLTEAEALAREALEGTSALEGAHHPDTFQSRESLAVVLRKLKRLDEARELYEQLLDDELEQLPLGHPSMLSTLSNLTRLHSAARRNDLAEPCLRTALDLANEAHGPDHVVVEPLLLGLASVTQGPGRESESDALTSRALEVSRLHAEADPADFLRATTGRAWFLSTHAQPRAAEELLCSTIDFMDRTQPELDSNAFNARYYLVQFLVDQGRFEDAEPYLLQCDADARRKRGVERKALEQVIGFYERWEHPELAERYRDELAALPAPASSK